MSSSFMEELYPGIKATRPFYMENSMKSCIKCQHSAELGRFSFLTTNGVITAMCFQCVSALLSLLLLSHLWLHNFIDKPQLWMYLVPLLPCKHCSWSQQQPTQPQLDFDCEGLCGWLSTGRAVSLLVSRSAASSFNVEKCVWMDECETCCNALLGDKKLCTYVTFFLKFYLKSLLYLSSYTGRKLKKEHTWM